MVSYRPVHTIQFSNMVASKFQRLSSWHDFGTGMQMAPAALRGCDKSNMATSKPEIPRSQLPGEIETKFQRHIGYTTSGLVGQYLHWFHSIAESRKCRFSRCDSVSISPGSWDIGISGLEATRFTTSCLVERYLHLSHSIAGPQKCGFSRCNFVSISSGSWDIGNSGLEAAILDLPYPV